LALVLAAGAYGVILEGQLHWRQPVGATAENSAVIKDSPDGLEWHPWSPEAVTRARKEGHVVLVDFTAKWCPNCRYNKKVAIDIPEVRQKLAALKGVVFRADFTNGDPRIAKTLKEHDRAGVPLVLIYPADPEQPPLVLPAILTPGTVLEALDQAGGKSAG
jgi:thiol:disulfide interchange protein DsbD